jgi:negative regulator of flagellin synthesis FlgM
MSNKIDGYGSGPVVTGGSRVAPVEHPSGDAAKPAPAAPPGGDSVTLTNTARTLQKLADAIAAAPVVDSARVDSIKSAIASNSYQVDALRVAAKLIAADREPPVR